MNNLKKIGVYYKKNINKLKRAKERVVNMEENKYLVIDGKQKRTIDLTGKIFGQLKVIKLDIEKYKLNKIKLANGEIKTFQYYWICQCNCEEHSVVSVPHYNLIYGKTISCGCYKNNLVSIRFSNNYIKSFKEWCLENNHQDYLNLWDYELNNKKPEEIGYGSSKKIYFKCLNGLHNSELKKIKSVIRYGLTCNQCDSFAQWGIDNVDINFLEKYWDFSKNTINPWEIFKSSNNKIWLKCINKNYHGSYLTTCNTFKNGCRCPYCSSKKVHPKDSMGQFLKDNNLFDLWSNKNSKNPFEISIYSNKEYWFKCHNNIHNDYKRSCNNAMRSNFKCPECNVSKGEQIIIEFLINYNIFYLYQHEYSDLIGVGGGFLSYDFYLPKYNLLIEYQGNFHDGSNGEYTQINLENQQEHDRRKRQYAQDNNIKLLEIWYWDFENIEEILIKELKIN